MSDLFASLTVATRALAAQTFGLEVTGQNIANVNTPGYTRRVADFAPTAPDNPLSAGRGVDVVGVRSIRDRLIERRLSLEVPLERREAAVAEQLSMVESTLGVPGSSIDASLGALFDAFSSLSTQPTSPVARQQVVLAGQSLAASFADMAARLDASQRDADVKVRAGVEEVNGLTTRIAALNETIGNATGGTRLHLQDEQQALVRQLSELMDVRVLEREGGGVDITVGQGRPLVVGKTDYQLEVTSAPPSGFARIAGEGVDLTAELTGGRVGGLLHSRDTLIPDYEGRLDQLAADVATQVNTVHRAGYDLSGATTRDFFAPPATVAGAARALAVDPALAADPSRIAASGSTATGDNAVARQLAGLRDERVLGGGTLSLTDSWSQLVYRVGRDAQAANDAARSRGQIVRQVDALRDEVSGVSLDEEAMHLLKYQRAYEAIARFFTTVDRSLETLINAVGR